MTLSKFNILIARCYDLACRLISAFLEQLHSGFINYRSLKSLYQWFLYSVIVPYYSQALQLGPTEQSRYWLYWVPAQYVEAVKDAILGKWQYF